MRWKTPKPGDTRVVKRFAFFPICINGEVRWLEMVSIRQRFWIGSVTGNHYWDDMYFVD